MQISLYNRQRTVRFSMTRLERFAPLALESCLREPAPGANAGAAPLPHLPAVEVTFLSDAAIARIHRQFMNIPGPTDVITFDHGEIVIGVGAAQANAGLYGKPLEEELALYIVHGLLHLNGFDDKEAAAAKLMRHTQERILAHCLARCDKKGR